MQSRFSALKKNSIILSRVNERNLFHPLYVLLHRIWSGRNLAASFWLGTVYTRFLFENQNKAESSKILKSKKKCEKYSLQSGIRMFCIGDLQLFYNFMQIYLVRFGYKLAHSSDNSIEMRFVSIVQN